MPKSTNPSSSPPTWQGELLLACRKCQKKLKGHDKLRPLEKLKRTVKQLNKTHPGHPLHLVNVRCMDVCPKLGVTVCLPQRSPLRLYILRSEQDLEHLYSGVEAEHPAGKAEKNPASDLSPNARVPRSSAKRMGGK